MTFNPTNKGYDCSYYQGAVDFAKMKNYGAKFVILRLGYAISQDTKFVEYMAGVNGVLPHNAYHYYDPIYNPTDQANKVIAILAPYKSRIKRVWLDFEFYWSGNYSAPQHWLTYRNAIRAAGYKTGIYTRATWWDSRVGVYAVDFGTDPLWAAQYNTALTLIPKGWTKAMLWQRGTPAEGIAAGVSSKEIDEDLWNDEFDFATEWGAVPSFVDGYQSTRRNNSDVHLWRGAPKRVHVTKTNGLETVSSAAKRLGADVAINGDGWYSSLAPLSLASSDGNFYSQSQFEMRPYISITQNNLYTIAHVSPNAPYNLVSGTRYLVINFLNFFAASTDPEHITERNPRTAVGYTKDGKLILCVVDGRSVVSAGVTLKELADILIEAGAWYGLELDGGGSSALFYNGEIKNIPSDGQERPVINHLLVYTTNGEPMSGTLVSTTHNLSVRPLHQAVNSSTLITIPMNKVVSYSELWKAPATTTVNNLNDIWAHVNYGGFDGWVGLVHLGIKYGTYTEAPAPTPVDNKPASIDMTLSAGSVVIIRNTAGVELWKGTA